MDYIRNNKVAQVWTEDLLSAFTPKQLRALANYVLGVTAPLEKDLQKFYNEHPPRSDKDRSAALEYAGRKETGDVMKSGSLEESAMQRGGYVRYSEESVWIHKAAGEIETYYNAVVPIAMAGKQARQGLFALASIFAALIKVDGDMLAFNVPPSIWEKHWGGKEMVVRPAQVYHALSLLENTFKSYDKWNTLMLSTKQSLTDVRWVSFLVDFFNTCLWTDYFACHSILAYEFLKIFRRDTQGRYKLQMVSDGIKKVPFVAAESYIYLSKSITAKMPEATQKAADEVRGLLGRTPVVLLGPFSTKHRAVDPSDADFAKARKAMESGNIIRGGESSGSSVLANSVGFSGLVTKLTKHTLMMISTILSVARTRSVVDIYTESIGPIPVVYQSVVNALQTRKFVHSFDMRFIVSYADASKVAPEYQNCVATNYRKGAHRIWISNKTIPSDKGVNKVLEKTAEMFAGLGDDFTFYGPVFGSFPFSMQSMHVFSHGWPSDFKGFVSTEIKNLVGANVDKKGASTIVEVPCRTFDSESMWYAEVIYSNIKKNGYFLRPCRRYSPISNLMTPPSKGVTFVVKDATYEYGTTGAARDWITGEEEDSEEGDYYDDEEEMVGGENTAMAFDALNNQQYVPLDDTTPASQEPSDDEGEDDRDGYEDADEEYADQKVEPPVLPSSSSSSTSTTTTVTTTAAVPAAKIVRIQIPPSTNLPGVGRGRGVVPKGGATPRRSQLRRRDDELEEVRSDVDRQASWKKKETPPISKGKKKPVEEEEDDDDDIPTSVVDLDGTDWN